MFEMFGMMIETYARNIVKVNNKWYIVDTIKPGDTNRWETGLAEVDLEALRKFVDEDLGFDLKDDEELDDETIYAYADDFTDGWSVESHSNKKIAIKRHAEICKTARLR